MVRYFLYRVLRYGFLGFVGYVTGYSWGPDSRDVLRDHVTTLSATRPADVCIVPVVWGISSSYVRFQAARSLSQVSRRHDKGGTNGMNE